MFQWGYFFPTPPESGRRGGRLTPGRGGLTPPSLPPSQPTVSALTRKEGCHAVFAQLSCAQLHTPTGLGCVASWSALAPPFGPNNDGLGSPPTPPTIPALSRPSPLPPAAKMNNASCRRDRGPISCASGVTCEELQPECAAFGCHERESSDFCQAPCSHGPTWRHALHWPTEVALLTDAATSPETPS